MNKVEKFGLQLMILGAGGLFAAGVLGNTFKGVIFCTLELIGYTIFLYSGE